MAAAPASPLAQAAQARLGQLASATPGADVPINQYLNVQQLHGGVPLSFGGQYGQGHDPLRPVPIPNPNHPPGHDPGNLGYNGPPGPADPNAPVGNVGRPGNGVAPGPSSGPPGIAPGPGGYIPGPPELIGPGPGGYHPGGGFNPGPTPTPVGGPIQAIGSEQWNPTGGYMHPGPEPQPVGLETPGTALARAAQLRLMGLL